GADLDWDCRRRSITLDRSAPGRCVCGLILCGAVKFSKHALDIGGLCVLYMVHVIPESGRLNGLIELLQPPLDFGEDSRIWRNNQNRVQPLYRQEANRRICG